MKSLSTIGIIVCVVLLFTTDVVIANDTECNITIDKKCLVAPPPAGPFDCDDKVDALKMIWNGPGTLESVIAYRGKVGKDEIPVSISNDVVTVSGYQPSTDDVQWQWFTKEGGSGISEFHLSCSDEDMNGPEDCGTPQGDGKNEALSSTANVWLLDGLTTDKGFVLDCTPQSAEFLNNCEFEAPPPPNCETLGKPTSLTFRYTGLGCSASSNNQGDKSDCSGDPIDDPVAINIVKDEENITVSPSSGINVGDLVTVFAISSDMGSEIQLNVGGQLLKIHTSCSAPLAAGDVFGSLELVNFNGIGSGAEVTYSYEVTNIGDNAVGITSVFDDQLGELLENQPVNLLPDESLTLEKTTFISETTTNTVTARAQPCGEATDQVTVTVTEPTYDVAVDIKPGSYPNSINPRSKGTIPVAILSSMDFDAITEVDTESLTFGPTGDEESLAFCSPSSEDVNDDGYVDLVCHFYTQMTGFECGDEEGILKGQTVDETPVEGRESVRIVPSACR